MTDLRCPRCESPLELDRFEQISSHYCAACEGVFIESRDLEAVLGGSVRVLDAMGVSASEPMACPRRCADRMTRQTLSVKDHHLELDVCPFCRGMWFDAGELDTIENLSAVLSEVEAERQAQRHLQRAQDYLDADKAKGATVAHAKSSKNWWLLSFVTGLTLEGHNPLWRRPFVTWSLALACVVVFVMEIYAGPAFAHSLAFSPGEAGDGAAWFASLFTAMFAHGSFGHLFGNMYFLIVFGDNVEDRLGRIPYIVLYFTCGLAAKVAWLFTAPEAASVLGASGAVAGVLGAYAVFFPGTKISLSPKLLTGFRQIHLPAFVFLLGWLMLQVIFLGPTGGSTRVAVASHIGGFVTGMVLAVLARQLLPDARLELALEKARSEHAHSA